MTVRLMNRRMFLHGAAGATVAIPFLPSILGGSRAEAAIDAPRCFVSLRTGHGGMWRHEFFPAAETAPQTQALGPLPWEAHHGPLSLQEVGGRAQLSTVLSALPESLTPRVVSTMNALCGLDYTYYTGHNNAANLGAIATALHDWEHQDSWGPSIDQLIAYSPDFYPQNAAGGGPDVAHPVVHTAATVGHVRPTDPTSPVTLMYGVWPRDLWSVLFQPGGRHLPGGSDPQTELEVQVASLNDAYAAYARLKSRASAPGSRLSALDRERLDRHMDRLASVRARFEAAALCNVPQPARDLPGQELYALQAELTRAAIECGLSRVFNYAVHGFDLIPEDDVARFNGSHSLAHTAADEDLTSEAHAIWQRLYQRVFEHAVLPMVHALDFEDAEGRNVLDHSLILWSSESGMKTHAEPSVPVVTFGSLNGTLSTGRFVDYRGPRQDDNVRDMAAWLQPEWRWGLTYDQLLGTILRAFGVELSEYDRYRARPEHDREGPDGSPEGAPLVGGYSAYSYAQSAGVERFHHEEDVRTYADEPLPLLWNG